MNPSFLRLWGLRNCTGNASLLHLNKICPVISGLSVRQSQVSVRPPPTVVLPSQSPPSAVGKVQGRLQHIFKEDAHENLHKVLACTSVFEALDTVEHYVEGFSKAEIGAVMQFLFCLIKENRNSATNNLFQTIGMQKLWKAYRKKSRFLDKSDIIEAIKVLTFLKVPPTNVNFDVSLQILSKQANSLDLENIIYINYLLKQIPQDNKTSIVTALEYALPIIFESQLLAHTQLVSESLQALVDCLQYSATRKLSTACVNSILDALLRKTNEEEITPRQALSIIWSVAGCPVKDASHEKLLNACFKVVSESINSYHANELSTVMSKLVKRFTRNARVFYNEDLIHAYCCKMMGRNIDPTDALWSLKWVSMLKFIHVDYIDRIGEIIKANPSLLLDDENLFLSVVRGLASLNYKPAQWEKLTSLFSSHSFLLSDKFESHDVATAVNLISLDIFPDHLIGAIFSEKNFSLLDNFFLQSPYYNSYILLLLLNSLKQLYPDYQGPFPPNTMVEKWKAAYFRRQYINRFVEPIKKALETVFGGEIYVINGLQSGGLKIDFGVVLRRGGFAIALNMDSKSKVEVTEIITPEESEIVLIKLFFREAYNNNTPRLRGLQALEQRVLEKLNTSLVVLDVERWTSLPDHEKIPFLMQRCRTKINSLSWNNVSSDVVP